MIYNNYVGWFVCRGFLLSIFIRREREDDVVESLSQSREKGCWQEISDWRWRRILIYDYDASHQLQPPPKDEDEGGKG